MIIANSELSLPRSIKGGLRNGVGAGIEVKIDGVAHGSGDACRLKDIAVLSNVNIVHSSQGYGSEGGDGDYLEQHYGGLRLRQVKSLSNVVWKGMSRICAHQREQRLMYRCPGICIVKRGKDMFRML